MNIYIIPAMYLIDGACVRLAQGDYDRRTTYGRDPLDTALRFEAAGLRRLHMVDLDGARTQRPANLKVLERIASTAAASKAARRSATSSRQEPDAPSAAASPCANPTAWPRGWRSSAASA